MLPQWQQKQVNMLESSRTRLDNIEGNCIAATEAMHKIGFGEYTPAYQVRASAPSLWVSVPAHIPKIIAPQSVSHILEELEEWQRKGANALTWEPYCAHPTRAYHSGCRDLCLLCKVAIQLTWVAFVNGTTQTNSAHTTLRRYSGPSLSVPNSREAISTPSPWIAG
ncbi:hypothetical protein AB1N83_008511 [Pleurotus pulmonarius]